jgi:uncharacterized protein YkwD
LAIAFAVAIIGLAARGSAAAATRAESNAQSASAQSDLIALINAYRSANSLQVVSANVALTAAATWMAGDMAAKNYIAHVSSDGRSATQRMSAFGYPATSMHTGENLGAGYGTASAVLAGWQASVAHNAVLLNPNYDAVGIGLVYEPSSTYKWHWAADFGGAGGTVKVVLPPVMPEPVAPTWSPAMPEARAVADRAAPAPRDSARESAEKPLDAEAIADEARAAVVDAKRIAHLLAVLERMGEI